MRCRSVRRELTALAEGELRPTLAAKARAHVQRCAPCARELRDTEKAIAVQRAALASTLPELSFTFETRLRQRLREAAAEADSRSVRGVTWLWKPALVAGVAVLAVLVAAGSLDQPSPVLVPLGIQAPPAKLAKEPDLFLDYPIIEHLEELENFETVNRLPYEEELLGESKGAA